MFGFQGNISYKGGLTYNGTWDALLNLPPLASGVGVNGEYYIVSVAGTTNLDGITDWEIGDWAIFNGTTWQKIDNTDAISGLGVANEITYWTGVKQLGSLATTTYPSLTELSYVKGVTSAIQTQLDTKVNELITANRQVASYVLALSDKNKLVEMNVGSANNLTIPLNSSIPFSIGTQILISQYGAGQTTILPTGGVTLRSAGGKTKLTSQYSGATIIKIATDEWYLFGDITT